MDDTELFYRNSDTKLQTNACRSRFCLTELKVLVREGLSVKTISRGTLFRNTKIAQLWINQ